MGKWSAAKERIKAGRPTPALERQLGVIPYEQTPSETLAEFELYKAQKSLQARDYTTAKNLREARHLPMMQHVEAGGNGPHKMVGVSYEILRAFVRQNPWVGAAVNIRQREVGSSKWRIVPALDEHKNELDILRQVVMGVRQFPEMDYLKDSFRPQYLNKKMVKALFDATLSPDGLTPSEVRYRFRLAYLELLIEANAQSMRARRLLEKPTQEGDADSWAEILKGIIPDILVLDCGALELLRADTPRDDFGHTKPTNPIREIGWIDGATLRPCLDDYGALRVPTEDDPQAAAYEQWIEGQCVATFQRHNVIRFIENPQTDIFFRGYGFSRVEYLMMTMILEAHGDKAKLEEFKRAFYGGFLNVKSKTWVQEDIDSFRGYIEEQLEGGRKLPILSFPDGAEWISAAMKESSGNNAVEQRRHHIERICATFELPPVKLGITNTSNYSTSEVSQEAGDDGLRHLLDVVDRGVTSWIVRDPGFGSYEYLRYESRPSHERETSTELEEIKQELEMGIVLPNEVRMERGDGPIEGGDKPYAYFQEFHKAKGQSDGMGGMDEETMEDDESGDPFGGDEGDDQQQDDNRGGQGGFQTATSEGDDDAGVSGGSPASSNPSFPNGKGPKGKNQGKEPKIREPGEVEKALEPLRDALQAHIDAHGTAPVIDVEILEA